MLGCDGLRTAVILGTFAHDMVVAIFIYIGHITLHVKTKCTINTALRIGVFSIDLVLVHFTDIIRVTSDTPGQSYDCQLYDCPNASEAILKDMDKCIPKS